MPQERLCRSVTPHIRTQVTQIHDKLTREAFTEKGDCVKQDTRKFTNVSWFWQVPLGLLPTITHSSFHLFYIIPSDSNTLSIEVGGEESEAGMGNLYYYYCILGALFLCIFIISPSAWLFRCCSIIVTKLRVEVVRIILQTNYNEASTNMM